MYASAARVAYVGAGVWQGDLPPLILPRSPRQHLVVGWLTVIAIRRLEEGDDVSGFVSGNDALDTWLKKNGHGNQHKYGVTYLAFDGAALVGYVAVTGREIPRARIGGGGPSVWPVLLLGRMAVVTERQRNKEQRIGEQMLKYVFTLAAQQHYLSGCAAVIVDSKPEAVGFYSKYGFKPTKVGDEGPSASTETQMYIAIKTVLAAIPKAKE